MTLDPQTSELLGPPVEGSWTATSVHRTLLDFWNTHALETGLVPKTAVDPIELKSVLPSLMLLKRSGLHDWKFTVVGTGVVGAYGEDFSGTSLSELTYSPCRNVYEGMISESVSSLAPQLCIGRMRYPGREFLDSVKTVFPVSDNGLDVTHCLFGISIENRPRRMVKIYEPVAPLEAFDHLYRIGSRHPSGESDTWTVTFVDHIHSVA